MSVRSLSSRTHGDPDRSATSGLRTNSVNGEIVRGDSETGQVLTLARRGGSEASVVSTPSEPVIADPGNGSSSIRVIAAPDGGPRWWMRGTFAEALLDGGELPLAAWRAAGRLRVVKQGPHRIVWRLSPESAAAPAMFIKRFECRTARDRLANALRGSRARMEWNAALAVASLGIPTISPVLLGEEPRTVAGLPGVGTSYLVTPEIAQSEPLDELVNGLTSGRSMTTVPQSRQFEFRVWLARSLGRIAGQLHTAGILHPDLHAGNLLVTGRSPGDWQLWLIDLHALRQTRGLSDRQRESNVAELARFFLPYCTRADRARFLRAYRAVLPVEWRPHNHAADLLERMAFDVALELGERQGTWRTDAAWRRGNRHIARRDRGGVLCRALTNCVPAGLAGSWLDDWIASPNDWAESRRLQWCKQSVRRQVAAIRGEELGRGSVVYVKRIVRQNWLERLGDLFRTPIVRHAWLVGHELLRRGIPTPEPMAYLVRRHPSGRGGEQWLVTDGVEQTTTVSTWLDQAGAVVSREQLGAVGEHMADALARLHRWGYDHRDLKFANWLIQEQTGRVWLLDLDAVRRRSVWWSRLTGSAGLGRERRVKNLARLAVSAGCHARITLADGLRFLRRYLALCGEPTDRSAWKSWWRSIALHVDRKRQQNSERGRPLS